VYERVYGTRCISECSESVLWQCVLSIAVEVLMVREQRAKSFVSRNRSGAFLLPVVQCGVTEETHPVINQCTYVIAVTNQCTYIIAVANQYTYIIAEINQCAYSIAVTNHLPVVQCRQSPDLIGWHCHRDCGASARPFTQGFISAHTVYIQCTYSVHTVYIQCAYSVHTV
jgi:hypothetical protein